MVDLLCVRVKSTIPEALESIGGPKIHHTPLRCMRFFFGIDGFKTEKKGLHKYYKDAERRMVRSEL